MPTHAEKRVVPYTPEQMYALIADVEDYPEFLPWCAACRIRSRKAAPEGREVMDADLVVSFKVFRERFGSRVTLDPVRRIIDVAYLEGPFRYLNNHWRFNAAADGGCEIDFFVDFEFRSRMLQTVVGAVFNEAMQRIVRAFERRADEIYGPGTAAG